LIGETRVVRLAHVVERFRDLLFRNNAEEWRLVELRGQTLTKRTVKNRIAGSVGKLGENNGVFVRQWLGPM
jgi:ribosomal protein S17E